MKIKVLQNILNANDQIAQSYLTNDKKAERQGKNCCH